MSARYCIRTLTLWNVKFPHFIGLPHDFSSQRKTINIYKLQCFQNCLSIALFILCRDIKTKLKYFVLFLFLFLTHTVAHLFGVFPFFFFFLSWNVMTGWLSRAQKNVPILFKNRPNHLNVARKENRNDCVIY